MLEVHANDRGPWTEIMSGRMSGDSYPRFVLKRGDSTTTPIFLGLGSGSVSPEEISFLLDKSSPFNPIRLRLHANSGSQTILELNAPSTDPKESTVTLTRNGAGYDEVVDLYNQAYPGAEQWGLNYIKNGINSQFRPFVISFQDGWAGAKNEVLRIDPTGNVGIGTTAPGQKLDVAGGYIRSDTGFCIGTSCITSWPSGGGISGSGTTNYIAKWTGSTSLGNSIIYDNGTNVGIGTTTPSAKLEINGNLRVGTVAQTGSANRFRMLQSMVRATKSTSQSIPPNVATAITFDGETFDTDSLHDNVTNNTRLTASISGKWLVIGNVEVVAGGLSGDVKIVKNGGNIYAATSLPLRQNGNQKANLSAIVDLNAGDYVELIVIHSGLSSVPISYSNTFFSMVYIGE